MTASDAPGRYRPDIDGLRAVAVLPVVLYHAGLGFPAGYFGVDIFFVISGYLIIKIIYDPMVAGKFSAAEFYERRIRRLFPAMFAMLLATTLWSLGWLIAPDLRDFGGSLIAALSYVSNFYFYFTDTAYFVEAALTKPLLHSWSLGVEEQFYILAPLGLWALVRLTPRRAHVPAILLLSVLSFALNAWKPAQGSPASFYLLPPRAWELGLGGALALAALPLHRIRGLAEALAAGGLAAILLGVLIGRQDSLPSVWHAALPVFGTAAILASGTGPGALVHRLLAIAPLTFVGRISYSLYLWHWPVIAALSYGSAADLPTSTALLAVAVSLALAAASCRWIEQPVRSRRRVKARRRLFGLAAAASAAGIALGLGLVAANGLPGRHPALNGLTGGDRASVRRDCIVWWPGQTALRPPCLRGAPGAAPSFVLVGDSHAHSISDGLFEAARARGLAGMSFIAPGFVPLPGRHTRGGSRPEHLVPLFEAYLRRNAELRTVIIAAFWSPEATGRNYRQPMRFHTDSEDDGSGAAYNPVALRNALERLFARFPDRRFILLDDVPFGLALDPFQRARSIFTGRGEAGEGLPRAVADAQRATYEPILARLAAEHPNVVYMPLLSRLCGPRLCPLADENGRVLYMDGDHLSAYGSARLAPVLDAVFAARREEPR
jgi:peptidoglycan/LPS O-acetylase OafA/YrhL